MYIVIETVWVLLRLIVIDPVVAIYYTFLPARLQSKNVKDQRVLITGAGSGLGRGLAVKFAEKKSVLVLWDINTKGNEETAEMCRKLGAKVFTQTVDLSNRQDTYDAADKAMDEVRDIDILVNNAGIVTGKKILDCPDELMEKTMAVNINAHFWTTKAFLPSMMARNHGHIVTIASGAGLQGVAGLGDYCASKFAAVGFHESITYELEYQGKNKVQTTVVCPAFINTGMFEGAKSSRFGALLPNLETDDAVDRIFTAILCNQRILMMPRLLYFVYALKGIVPFSSVGLLLNFFKVNNGMDNFVGRSKQE